MYQKIKLFRKYFFQLDENIYVIKKLTFWGYWVKHRIGIKGAWKKAMAELNEIKSETRFYESDLFNGKK